jgi:hypothetical protein
MKNVDIQFSHDALTIYEYMSKMALSSKSERIMLTSLLRKIELIKQNPSYGQAIAKRLMPKEYIKKYRIKNLYRVELPFFWRMLYSLGDDGNITIIALIVDIIDHKQYNKKFKYK